MENRIPYNEADENYITIYDMMELTGLSKATMHRKINKVIDDLEKENPEILQDWVLKKSGSPTLYHKLFFEKIKNYIDDPPADETPQPEPPENETPPDETPPQPDPEPEPPADETPKSMNYYFLLVFAVLVVLFLFYFF